MNTGKQVATRSGSLQGGEKHVYIFNHIMKCGGTSFSSYLFNHLNCDVTVQLYMLNTIEDFYPQWRAGAYNDIKKIYVGGHFIAGAHKLFPGHTPRYMTMLREPLDRFLSSYKMSQDIGILPEVDGPEAYFEGAWHNFLTLAIGNGDLETAKKNLVEEYAFVGIIEDYERSCRLLAHVFDLDAVAWTHANKSSGSVKKEDLDPDFIARFYEANADDVELYRFGCELFNRQWEQHRDAMEKNPRPLVERMPKIDIMFFVDSYLNDSAPRNSFVFEPWSEDKEHLSLFWGVLYRISFLPLFFALLKRGRFKDLRTALSNLKKFHAAMPYAHTVIGQYLDFFERITPRGMAAVIGKIIAFLNIDMSGMAKQTMGDAIPITSVGYLSFMDTDRMMALSGVMENKENIREKIEQSLQDD